MLLVARTLTAGARPCPPHPGAPSPGQSPTKQASDGDRVFRSQLTWISGAPVGLLSWWILSYSIGVRILRAVWRRWRLWKISRYSNIALANSIRVRRRRRSNSSTCIRAQNDSINALSKQSPTDTDRGNEPGLLRPVRERPGGVGGALVWVDHRLRFRLAVADSHTQGGGERPSGGGVVDGPAHDPAAEYVEDDRAVDLAFSGWMLGVGRSPIIGPADGGRSSPRPDPLGYPPV